MIYLVLLALIAPSIIADDLVHNPIQYHSQTPRGSYNYGYDTGLYGSHQFHQENKDNQGVVRGRYGYTDPDGKLRLTYYTAGPDGYNVIKDSTPVERTPVETVIVPAPVVHAPVVHARNHHHAPIVVTAPCKYRNPPCHQARVHQEPEKVNTYTEKGHYEQKVTTEIRSHPPAPVVHAQSTPQEHNHHHLHHRNHDSHTQTTPLAPVVHHSTVSVHQAPPVTVHHQDTVNTHHSKIVTKTVVDTPVQSQIIHQAPIAIKAPPPILHTPIAIKAPPPPPLIIEAPIAVKAPPPVIQQVVHQEQSKIHRSPVQVYRGKTAVSPRKYEEYAKGRYVPNYRPSSPYSRCWCE